MSGVMKRMTDSPQLVLECIIKGPVDVVKTNVELVKHLKIDAARGLYRLEYLGPWGSTLLYSLHCQTHFID